MRAAEAPPRVRQITLPLGRDRTVNSFLLAGEPLTLVDAGMPGPESLAALQEGLAAAGVAPADVQQVVVTHAHPDHYGNTAAVVRAAEQVGRRVHVLAHPKVATMLADPAAWWQRTRAYVQEVLRRTGAPPPVSGAVRLDGREGRASVDRPHSPVMDPATRIGHITPLDDGAKVAAADHQWQVVYTPGHASTQICLFDGDSGELFTSDHLLPDVSTNIVLEAPWPPSIGESGLPGHPALAYLDSLRRLAALPVTRAWPGHGPSFGDVRALVAERIARCEQRLDQAAAALAGGSPTAWAVAAALYAGSSAAGTQRAVLQTVAYLDALVAQQRAAVAGADGAGVWHYVARQSGR